MDAGKILGRGMSFPPRVGPDGRIAWSEGEANVRESIRVILMTETRERIMLPEFGGGLGRYLFEPNTVSTRSQIRERILKALERWEPRIAEIPSPDFLEKEVFGPILHVIRYDPDDIDKVGAELSAKGYGLTLGVHSRLEGFAEKVKSVTQPLAIW